MVLCNHGFSLELSVMQDCLKAHNYQQHECQDVIDRLYRCCEHYQLFGRSPQCAGLPQRRAPDAPSDEESQGNSEQS